MKYITLPAEEFEKEIKAAYNDGLKAGIDQVADWLGSSQNLGEFLDLKVGQVVPANWRRIADLLMD